MEEKFKYQKIIKEVGKEKIILLIIAFLFLVLCQIPWEKNKSIKKQKEGEDCTTKQSNMSEELLEKRLENTLSEMDGVGKARVLITFESSEENIVKEDLEYEKSQNEEENQSSGKKISQDIRNKKDTIYETNADGKNVPYIIKKLSPKIEGVAVIAEGGKHPEVVEKIKEVVTAVLDVEAHKISVVKMK